MSTSRGKRIPFGPRRLRRGDEGSTAVEFAIVAPVLLAMLLGIFECGRAIWTQSLLDYAVEQAARCSSLGSCGTTATTYASQLTAPLNIPASDFSATSQACGSSVTATYPFHPIVSALVPISVTLTSSSCYPT